MKISNIHEKWGTLIEVESVDEVLNLPTKFLRDVGYDRDLVIIRGIGKVSDIEMHDLLSRFGKPWTAGDYRETTERPYEFTNVDGSQSALTVFSNLTACRLGTMAMPWHADVPNNGKASFPWRSLYITKNPNPESGFTDFLNVRLDLIDPNEETLRYYQSITILTQSWYLTGESDNIGPFIKDHPITGKQSLRLNQYVDGPWSKSAWIKESFVNGEQKKNSEVIAPILANLAGREDLLYRHKWQDYDFVIYDNWNFVHKRTRVEIDPGEVREFIRANVHHK